MRILFAAVCTSGNDDCTLNFATSLLNFLNAMDGQHQINVDFIVDVNSGLDKFSRDASFDRLILCNTRCAADPDFLRSALFDCKQPFVTGVCPRSDIDWERVKTDGPEDISSRGLSYNVDLSASKPSEHKSYVKVPSTTLQAVVLHRAVIAKILSAHGEEVKAEPANIFYCRKVRDGKSLDADANFCHMWSGDIYADVEHPVSFSGPQGFCGCVGARQVLR